METEKKNKANFKAQTTLKGVKRKLDTGFLRPDDDGRSTTDEERRCTARPSSIIPHPSCHTCPLPAGENSGKSFGAPTNQPDEAKNFLDAKTNNMLNIT